MQSYENFYPGMFRPPEHMPETAYSDLFIGYRFPVGKLGAGASAMTVNQIAEVNKRLNTGMKIVEAGPISAETFEKIPKQHFKEINRLAKLTGAEITWHAPIIDPAGLSEGGKITEESRKQNEELLWDAIKKATEATGGNQPITIHATAGVPATLPEAGIVGIANVAEGNVFPIKLEPKIKPEEIAAGKKPTMPNPEEFLEEINRERWIDILNQLELKKSDLSEKIMVFGDKKIEEIERKKREKIDEYSYKWFNKSFDKLSEREKKEFENYLIKNKEAREVIHKLDFEESKIKESEALFEHLMNSADNLFNLAWKASEQTKDTYYLNKLKNIGREIGEIRKLAQESKADALIRLTDLLNEMKQITPKFFVPAEEFAKEKVSETLSNLAVKAYTEFKDRAPILSIENIFPEWAFGTAESLKKLIEESRQKFVEKMKSKLGEARARQLAEQLIGATWDIGHANIWKKYGKKPEEIKAMLEEIKPFVKHIHITDNFGFSDSHLPPGMAGIEPEIFKELESLIKEKGVKGVLEIPTLAIPEPQGFGVSPYPYALAALGSPIYSYDMAPFWNQALAADLPAYFTGYGPILPEKHFEVYGASFAGLPVELGGQTRKRGFSEAPME